MTDTPILYKDNVETLGFLHDCVDTDVELGKRNIVPTLAQEGWNHWACMEARRWLAAKHWDYFRHELRTLKKELSLMEEAARWWSPEGGSTNLRHRQRLVESYADLEVNF